MASSTKQRSQGGGRTPNSEPRLQVFKGFSGCNFQSSPRDFTLGKDQDQEQSDLPMNYVVIQDNMAVVDNNTIETRNNLITLFDAPTGRKLTDASILIGDKFFIGLDDGSVAHGNIGSFALDGRVTLVNHTNKEHHWRSFAYADSQLIGTTEEQQLWTGQFDGQSSYTLENSAMVANPATPTLEDQDQEGNLQARGDLQIMASPGDDTCCFRVMIAWSYVNKYGPTKCSDALTFYANHPVDEWHAGQFLHVHSTSDAPAGVKAVEFYYSVGNASTLQFAGRTDIPGGNGGAWDFDWFGYLDVTAMWPVANLIAPTENVTEGTKASYVTCVDSRLYFWGGEDNPQRLWIGGNPGNLFSVSPGTGGGFVDVEPGTGQEIRFVDKYKTQSGASIVTMLCDSKNSTREQRFNLVENSVTISNEQSMKSWQAEQVAGAVGCKSPHGAIVCEDGLYAVSRYGLALTTMTMEYNSQIRTNYVSDPIKPVFVNKDSNALKNAVLLEVDGVLYMSFGRGDSELDNLLFCYDIDLKAWWTISLDIDDAIIDMKHIDYEGNQEGIGIVTENAVYLLPTTHNDDPDDEATFDIVLQTGELSTTQPQQNWQYLSQMEFRFDYFLGDALVELVGIDQFGRKVSTKKQISHDSVQYNLAEFMRVDLRLQSYQVRITGQARFRLTHFIAKVYTMSSKQGLVWGFDDSQSYRSNGDIHPTFKDYNDIRKAIIP